MAYRTILFEDSVNLHDCGLMDVVYDECDARHFKGERPPDKHEHRNALNRCQKC